MVGSSALSTAPIKTAQRRRKILVASGSSGRSSEFEDALCNLEILYKDEGADIISFEYLAREEGAM